MKIIAARIKNMRILFRLLKSLNPYRLQLSALIACVFVVTTTSLITPTLIRSAIDDGLGKHDSNKIIWIALTIIAIAIIRTVFNFGRRYLSEWLINRTGYDFRNALYDKIQHLPFSYHDQVQTGQLMSRCTEDVSSLSRFVGQGAVDLFNILVLLGGIIVLLFGQSVILTLIGLAPIAILAVATVAFSRKISHLFFIVDQALGDLSATLQENLTGAQVVRAFAREEHEKTKFANAHRKLYDARVTVVSTWGVFMPTTNFLVMASTILILWFGGQMVMDGTLTLGALVAYNAYLIQLAGPVGELGFIVNAAGEAVAGGKRIFEILDIEEQIASPSNALMLPPLTGRVTFDAVTFAYRGTSSSEKEERHALRAVSFEAQPNQVIALIGPTGSGKTSIVNLIPRFYDPTEGRVCVDGIDVKTIDLKSLRAQIGIVLQSSLLFSVSIRDNISYGRMDATEDEIIAAAKAARADDFIRALPNGYDTMVGERGVTLSGGQRQRIAIARALLMDPRILILDDSTSSVDMQTEYLIQQALAELMKGRTTFVIAQRLATVKRADLILVLDDGAIVQRGTHNALLEQGGLYKEIYDLQLKDQEQFRREMLFLDEAELASQAGDGNGNGARRTERAMDGV